MKVRYNILPAILLALLASGCPGGSQSVVTFSVSPVSIRLNVGQSTTLSALSSLTGDTFTWSSGNVEVATVSQSGGVAAVGPGMTRISVSSVLSGRVASAAITVPGAEFAPEQVTVSPAAATIAIGDAVALTGMTTREDGILTWSSDNETAATVDENGVVAGVGLGTAAITALGTGEEERAAAAITVVEPPAPVATVRPPGAGIVVGETIALSASSADASDEFTWSTQDSAIASVSASGVVTGAAPGVVRVTAAGTHSGATGLTSIEVEEQEFIQVTVSPVAAIVAVGDTVALAGSTNRIGGTLSWSSADEGVVSVDQNGMVTGVGAGTVAVTAQGAKPNERSSALVTVVDPIPPVAIIRPSGASIPVGDTVALVAQSGDATEGFSWSSDGEAIATVDGAGVVTGVGAGTVEITAVGMNTGAIGTASITVTVPVVHQVVVAPAAATIVVGDNVSLSGSTTRPGDSLVWTSGNDAVATVNEDGLVVGISPGTALVTAESASHPGESSSATVTVVAPVAKQVTVRPLAASITAGERISLTATSNDPADGFTWTSDNESAATVDSAGVVMAVGPGTATITVQGTSSGESDTAAVTVTAVVVHRVEVTPGAASIFAGDTFRFAASTSRPGGLLTWSSGDESVATVDPAGLVTGVSAGTAPIVAQGADVAERATASITVMDVPAPVATVRPLGASITVGATATLTATSTDAADGFIWSSDNAGIATVNAAGVVTGIAPGTVRIGVRGTNSGAAGESTITVTEAIVHRVTVSPSSVSVFAGDTIALTGSTTRAGDTLTWSSGAPAVAAVNQSGVVSGIAVGIASITAQGANPDERASSTITVLEPAAPVATVRPLGATIEAGTMLALTATSPVAADGFTWSSSAGSVATVDASGIVTGIAEGMALITATGTVSGAQGSTTIAVTAPAVSEVTVTPGSATIAIAGEAVLTAASTNAGDSFTWSSSDVTVATVNSTGVVTGVGAGSARIQATGTASGATGRATITVVDNTVHEVMIEPAAATIFVADTTTLVATSTDTGDSFTWSSGNGAVATVSASGVVTGVGAGTTSITALGTSSGAGASATVSVNAHTVTVDPASVAVLAGTTAQLAASSTDAGDGFTWLSADQSIATVNASGLVTGVGGGTVTITASGTRSGAMDTAAVTVQDGVAVNPPTGTITEGATLQFSAQSTDSGDTFAWTSSDTAVARVNAAGLVTGVRAGNASITATGARSGESGSASLTVLPVLPVTPGTATVEIGRIVALSARAFDVDDVLAWTSSNTAVATVNGTGVVTGVRVGAARITVTGSHSGAVGVADIQVLPEFPNVVLFDGEAVFPDSTRSVRNTVEQFRGLGCLEGIPDQFSGFNQTVNGAVYRTDISRYDEIWMLVKAQGSGAHSAFSVRSFQGAGKEVELTAYAQGGTIGNSYKLLRIPLADLTSSAFNFTSIETVNFSKRLAGESFRLFIDDVWAVNLDSVDANGGPLAGTLRAFQFGNANVMTGATASLTVRNLGAANLVVSGARMEGAGAAAYSVTPTSFTVAPAGNQPIQVNFSPDMAGEFKASLVLAHNQTAFGAETRVPLLGSGIAARLALSSESVEFGQMPVSGSIVRNLAITNTGSAVLTVSAPVSSSGVFAVGSGALSLNPGETKTVAITGTPAAAGDANGTLQFTTNDPNRTAVTVPLNLTGLSAGALGKLPLEVLTATSSTLDLAWGLLPAADEVRVSIGPEPPAAADSALPLDYEVALLPGTAGGYKIEGLAAGVDVFVRVVASKLGAPVARRNIAAITPGGPRVKLDTPLREVHLFAPNIIQLVLADFRVHSFREDSNFPDSGIDEVIGYTGPQWQAGPWTVRRSNGAAISVQNVYRHSVPVGALYYEVGFGALTRDNLLDVDHMIYLQLAENVGSREVLEVVGPSFTYEILNPDLVRENRAASLDIILPFSDRYLVSTAIQVNQVGYSPAATERYAYLSGWMGDGGPLSLGAFPSSAGAVVESANATQPRADVLSNLPVRLRTAMDVDAGTEIRDIDISALPASETAVYRVRVPGVGVSWPTKVSETEVFRTFYHLARGMFQNRWAGDLAPEYTDFSRPQDHGSVFTSESLEPFQFFDVNTPRTGERPLLGGHHDAGDFDVRIYHGIVSEMLMRAYELNEGSLTDGQLVIPESGNNVPDLLDEALWSVAAWEYLQEDDGGVRIGAESFRHPLGIYLANDDEIPYWTFSRSPVFTARVAGLFAQASRLVAPFDGIRAHMLLVRAEKAYDYALANGVSATTGGPLLYAASELYRLTGEEQYRDMVISTWNANRLTGSNQLSVFDREIPPTKTFTETKQPVVWDFISGYLGSGNVVAEHRNDVLPRLKARPGQIAAVIDTAHGHRNARPAQFPLTFGKGTAVGQYLYGVYAAMQYGELDAQTYQNAFNALSLSADYTLGCNPAGMVWITGLGSRSPLDPLHLDTLSFTQLGLGVLPGIPVYGPADNLKQELFYTFGVRLAQPAYLDSPPARRYGDVHTFVNTSEFTVWECQAPMVELFAALIAPGMTPPDSWLPAAARGKKEGPKR